jgi:Flp pilus assembly protein TadD
MRNRAVVLQSHDDDEPEYSNSELSTSHLNTGMLSSGSNLAYSDRAVPEAEPDDRPNTDWLRVLASQAEYADTFDDPLPDPPPVPSGMGLHSMPARISPTIGARLGLALTRGGLFLVIAVVATVVIGAGAYGLTFTTWFSSLAAPVPASQAPASKPGANTQTGTQQAEVPAQAPSAPIAPGQDSTTAPGTAGDPKTLVEKGVAEYKLGHFDQAINLLESATEAGGSDAVTFYRLGLAYLAATGRDHGLEDAELAFRSASSIQPTWAAPQQMLAESLIRRGFFAEAIEPAKKAAQLDPNQAENWMTLGRAFQGSGQAAEATQSFAEAARHSPAPPTNK